MAARGDGAPDNGPVAPRRGNSNDLVRRHNLSVVLGLAHHDPSVSRSQLTKQTGLNRSTIAALVGELSELGLVVESEPDASRQVGRPSPIVAPHPGVVAIAVNPEIDSVTIALVGLGGRVLRRIRRDATMPTVDDTVSIVADAVDELRAEASRSARLVGIGVAVPGLVRASDGVVRLAPHLGWTDAPLARLLVDATGLPAAAANDAGLGAKAEHIFGAGRGHTDMIYLNGGASGIGGGIIAGGQPIRGAGGYAGEFGHTLATTRNGRDASGAPGSLELEVRRSLLLDALGIATADADELDARLLNSDSPAVRAEVERQLAFLGVALRNAIDILNPQLVVLGGFLGSLHAAAPGRLETLVADQALAVPFDEVRFSRAELGSDLLLVGAAELAFGPLLGNPAGVEPVPA
ncbi:putative NBD/HSP70 family sugar kinase/biotin operon repressor [Marisediminicola sp. UYEF4]|uniref:ROK family protein n=1 Tax=Marisediminicola sp. UYEF4 TaxID=1756384 RepID=UPI003390E981